MSVSRKWFADPCCRRTATAILVLWSAGVMAGCGGAGETPAASEGVAPPSSTVAAATASITFTNQCSAGIWVAELGNGASKACSTDADCNGGTCTKGACTMVLCQSGSDCTDIQFCNAASCTTDAQCPAVSCQSNADCTLPGQTCDAVSGVCTPTCQGGQCLCGPGAPACPANGTCVNNLCTGGVCQYELTPSPGYWQLAASGSSGDSETIQLPLGWAGRFWARTGCPGDLSSCAAGNAPCTQDSDCCNGACIGPPGSTYCDPATPACVTGDCGSSAACAVSAGAPVSLFEANFQDATTTWYDASLVDGINVPLNAVPVDGSGNPISSCSTAGCSQALVTSGLGPLQVLGSQSCTVDSDCPFLEECVGGTCVVGYSGACDQCTADPSTPGLDCATNLDLYCCSGPNTASCNGGTATCMNDTDCIAGGTCTNNICIPVSQACSSDSDCAASYICDPTAKACVPDAALASTCCGPFNPAWRAAAQPFSEAFKNACPTAYAYQFDDPSSDFSCQGQAVDFQVTFCP